MPWAFSAFFNTRSPADIKRLSHKMMNVNFMFYYARSSVLFRLPLPSLFPSAADLSFFPIVVARIPLYASAEFQHRKSEAKDFIYCLRLTRSSHESRKVKEEKKFIQSVSLCFALPAWIFQSSRTRAKRQVDKDFMSRSSALLAPLLSSPSNFVILSSRVSHPCALIDADVGAVHRMERLHKDEFMTYLPSFTAFSNKRWCEWFSLKVPFVLYTSPSAHFCPRSNFSSFNGEKKSWSSIKIMPGRRSWWGGKREKLFSTKTHHERAENIF